MKIGSRLVVAGAAVGAMVVSGAVLAKARNLQDLVGRSDSRAENRLDDRGFVHIESHRSGNYTHQYWWNRSDKDCVHVITRHGDVQSITDASDRDCNQKSGASDGEKVVAGVAAAAVIGAIIASKKHHREGKDYNEEQLREFDRGYTDGLHNASYHNYNKADAYSDGYQAGVDERNSNLAHHYNQGGYRAIAQFKDLQGARASSADGTLRDRGFTNVDAFKSGNTAYTIWNRSGSNQCLQMTVADGRVYDIRDIGTHPNCR